MQNDINNLDPEDIGLKSIMGVHFIDETVQAAYQPKTIIKTSNTTQEEKAAHSPAQCLTKANESAHDAHWETVNPDIDFMDKLKKTAKDVCLYAVLSMILFYWQQTGKLDSTASWYALLVCVGMVFFSIGKNWRGGVK